MNRKTRIVLLVVWIIVIFVLTGYPDLKTPRIKDVPIDKLYHFTAFMLLGILELRTLKTPMYFGVGSSVAVITELQQLFIPGREFEILDILAGIAGLVMVYIISRGKDLVRNGISKT